MSAAGNFSTNQQQLAQDMTAPLQAGQTQPAPMTFQQPGMVNPKTVAHEQYLQQIDAQRQQQAQLAEAMRTQASQSAQQAVQSGLASTNATSTLKTINSAGPIQARHPLDLLAIGIRGWKAHKAQKQVNATAAQAKIDAQRAAEQAAEAERAQKRADVLWEHGIKEQGKTPAAENVTGQDMETAFYYEDNLQEQQGIPPEKRQYSTIAMMGQDRLKGKQKRAVAVGGGGPQPGDKVEPNTTGKQKDKEAIEAGLRDYDHLTGTIEEYDPNFYGAEGVVKGYGGKIADFFGANPDNPTVEFMAKRDAFRGNIYAFANKLIKERSGAAVTQQEFERFMNEFPLSQLKGPAGFEAAMDSFVERISKENYSRMRTAGWVLDADGSLVYDKDSKEPMISGYKRTDTDFWDAYNAEGENGPDHLFENGKFAGFRKRGDAVRAAEAGGDNTGGNDHASIIAEAKAAIARGAPAEAVKARLQEQGIPTEGL